MNSKQIVVIFFTFFWLLGSWFAATDLDKYPMLSGECEFGENYLFDMICSPSVQQIYTTVIEHPAPQNRLEDLLQRNDITMEEKKEMIQQKSYKVNALIETPWMWRTNTQLLVLSSVWFYLDAYTFRWDDISLVDTQHENSDIFVMFQSEFVTKICEYRLPVYGAYNCAEILEAVKQQHNWNIYQYATTICELNIPNNPYNIDCNHLDSVATKDADARILYDTWEISRVWWELKFEVIVKNAAGGPLNFQKYDNDENSQYRVVAYYADPAASFLGQRMWDDLIFANYYNNETGIAEFDTKQLIINNATNGNATMTNTLVVDLLCRYCDAEPNTYDINFWNWAEYSVIDSKRYEVIDE